MGELIDITERLAQRRLDRELARWSSAPSLAMSEATSEPEIARDLLCELEDAREQGLCDTCGHRSAVAEVFRSDAIAAGLGGMYQCRPCLTSEIQHNRVGPEAKRIEWLITQLLRDADTRIRVEIDWDPRHQRAVALDGIRLA